MLQQQAVGLWRGALRLQLQPSMDVRPEGLVLYASLGRMSQQPAKYVISAVWLQLQGGSARLDPVMVNSQAGLVLPNILAGLPHIFQQGAAAVEQGSDDDRSRGERTAGGEAISVDSSALRGGDDVKRKDDTHEDDHSFNTFAEVRLFGRTWSLARALGGGQAIVVLQTHGPRVHPNNNSDTGIDIDFGSIGIVIHQCAGCNNIDYEPTRNIVSKL